ncbi:MAG: PfkB family carbohydrate kinase [Promethearchaeia archaeon]
MGLEEKLKLWEDKKVLIIGEALIDKYIYGFADRISPDAPIPSVKVEETDIYLGGIGLVLKFIKSLGGIPEICTVIGTDFEGQFFLEKIKELNVPTEGIIVDETIQTPQITRIKAMNQHLLRLETDYSQEFSQNLVDTFFQTVKDTYTDLSAILILDYGIGGLFSDSFVQALIRNLKQHYPDTPIIARPNLAHYYLYEDIDLIKINLQKALREMAIECCTDTSVTISGKRIQNETNSNNVFLNDIESSSYLLMKDKEKAKKIKPVLDSPVRSYVAVGSVIMACLGLSYAADIDILSSIKIALMAGSLSATLPPVEFFNADTLKEYIAKNPKKLD